MKQIRLLRWAGTLAFSLAVASTEASMVVLDNTAGGIAPIGATTAYMSTTRWVAKVFQTPAAAWWTLDQVRVALHTNSPSDGQALVLRLYAVDGLNNPTGASLAATTATLPSPLSGTAAWYSPVLLTGPGWKLDPDTKYALVASATGTNASLSWDAAINSYTTTDGFAFIKTAVSTTGGASWNTAAIWNGLTLEASVPEPGAVAYSLVVLGGVGGYLIRRRLARA